MFGQDKTIPVNKVTRVKSKLTMVDWDENMIVNLTKLKPNLKRLIKMKPYKLTWVETMLDIQLI